MARCDDRCVDVSKNACGDEKHPPLYQRESLAVLPWQLRGNKFVVAVYAMTFDATKPWIEQQYRLTIDGLPEAAAGAISYYDPLTDRPVPVEAAVKNGRLTVTLDVLDYPRLLVIGH